MISYRARSAIAAKSARGSAFFILNQYILFWIKKRMIRQLIYNCLSMSEKDPFDPRRHDVKFFVEYHPDDLKKPDGHEMTRPEKLEQLLTPEVCGLIESYGWGLSVAAIRDDDETARILQRINRDNPHLPIVMWVVLPDEQGYWTGNSNLKETSDRVNQLERWINDNNLDIRGLGFDIEPPLQALKGIMTGPVGAAMTVMRERAKLNRIIKNGGNPGDEFAYLVSEVRRRGITAEAYVAPFPMDKVLRLFEPNGVDKSYAMVYSSSYGPASRQLFRLSMKQGQYPAIGIVSHDGVNPGRNLGPVEKMNQRVEVARDLKTIQDLNSEKLSSFRVFALTGREVVDWTYDGLKQAVLR